MSYNYNVQRNIYSDDHSLLLNYEQDDLFLLLLPNVGLCHDVSEVDVLHMSQQLKTWGIDVTKI